MKSRGICIELFSLVLGMHFCLLSRVNKRAKLSNKSKGAKRVKDFKETQEPKRAINAFTREATPKAYRKPQFLPIPIHQPPFV